jgi:hypothetical protein
MEDFTLVQRVRSEFLEMPGLRLTPQEAARSGSWIRPAASGSSRSWSDRVPALDVARSTRQDGAVAGPVDRFTLQNVSPPLWAYICVPGSIVGTSFPGSGRASHGHVIPRD